MVAFSPNERTQALTNKSEPAFVAAYDIRQPKLPLVT
jgi:hypothetical protein